MSHSAPAATEELNRPGFESPYPGVESMPRWDVAELPDAPVFRWRQIGAFLGPAIVMAAAAIGGGEWLTGPVNAARYGGSLFWLCTLSILGQVVYNVEICRYTLYTGEPIFTGKFRIPPSPWFWVFIYLLVDFGSLLPYLAANAAVPLAAMFLGHLPDKANLVPVATVAGMPLTESTLVTILGVLVFMSVFIPLSVGGKIYNSMRTMMTFKLFYVFSLLLFLAIGYSTWGTWKEILTGFVKFGNLPCYALEDTNKNGVRDGDEAPHGSNVDNFFFAMQEGRPLRPMDMSLIGFIITMAAISGNGGLTNTPLSNYTRDQGWGMGSHVGAIPSMVGGHEIELSHVGAVFDVNEQTLPRWKRWLWHVKREQWFLWLPACFVGIALPSMLSIQFLTRGMVIDKNKAAGITADKVSEAVGNSFGSSIGSTFWYLMLFCGFLVLATSMASTADGVLRRWVDVFWTASPRLRQWDTKDIRKLYFGVLCVYVGLGTLVLAFVDGAKLVEWTGVLYNFALGVSCFHTVVVNSVLLPTAIRPRMGTRAALVVAGMFFTSIAVLSAYEPVKKLLNPPPATAKTACAEETRSQASDLRASIESGGTDRLATASS